MPITVTPSKQLEINLDDAEEGELLQLFLADRSSLIVTARRIWNESLSFFLEPPHMPVVFRDHVKAQTLQALRTPPYELRKWFEGLEDQSAGLYQSLYDSLTLKCSINKWKVGETPVISLGRPFSMGSADSPVSWDAPAAVTSIKPVDAWTGTLAEARILAEI